MNEKTIDRTAALLRLDRDDVTPADVPPAHAAVCCEDSLDEMYQKIGWWKGPNASDEARTLVCKFWQDQGDQVVAQSGDDPGLRECAARAARLLPRERALGLLGGPLNAEPDPDVRCAIQETLAGNTAK